MIHPTALLMVGDHQGADHVIWNQVADVRFLMLIDELRDQVLAAINANLAGQSQQPAEAMSEEMDYGKRPTS